MSNAHEGEADGLWVDGWVPEADSESPDGEPVTESPDREAVSDSSDEQLEDVPSHGVPVSDASDGSPVKVVTQPLPTVPDGPVRSSVPPVMEGDGSSQRAVARRAAAPLPNLGRDEAPEVDAPSRKRSRLVPVPTPPLDAAAEPAVPAPDATADSTLEPAMSTGLAMSTGEVAESEPKAGAHELKAAQPESATPAEPAKVAESATPAEPAKVAESATPAEPTKVVESENAATDRAASVAESSHTVVVGGQVGEEATAEAAEEAAEEAAKEAAAMPAATAASGSPGAPLIEGVVLGRSDVTAGADDLWSEQVTVAATARTAEATISARASVPVPEQLRPGPAVLPADSWDLEPEVVDDSRGGYHGRRRADAPAARLWLAITLVLVGLGAAIAIPLTLVSGSGGAAAPADSPTPVETIAEGPVSPFESLAATVSPTPSPAPSPSSSTSTRRPAPPPPPSPSPTPSPPPPPFSPLTIEAEAGGDTTTPSESTRDVAYPVASGGRIIQNIGDWGRPPGPGTLTFNQVAVPSTGTYTITIYYVHPNNEADRQAIVSVSGTQPVTVDFAGNSTCCLTKAVTVTMTAGEHTIMISNPTAHAPSVDKIVISRP